jgi:flagellar motor protein MotB
MPTVMTGAASAEKGSFSGGSGGKGGGKQKNSSSSEDTKEQKKVLKKAAQEATPFCEECQKKKEAEAAQAEEKKKEEKEEKKEEEKNPKILQIYWMDEQNNFKTLDELSPGQEVTLCVEVEEGGAGEKITVEITNDNNCKFKGGKSSLKFTDLIVDDDNTAYIDNFKYEFEEE